MTRTQRTLIIVSPLIAIFPLTTNADYRAASSALDVSGGEDHTLIVTADKGAWACGPNGYVFEGTTYYYGVLGIASEDPNLQQNTLVRIHGPNDVNYLHDISDIDAGWQHSLALDANDSVWSWGWNSEGQLGLNHDQQRTTPQLVLRGQQPDDPCHPSAYLKHIIAISAGRSGEHSLAVDANGYAYAWGCNHEGQCGVGLSGTGFKELDPNHVLRGEQPFDPNRPSVYLNRIIAVSAGEWHSMALEQHDPCDPNMDGRVYTCGDNDFLFGGSGVLGIGDYAGDSNTPVCVLRGHQDYNEPNHMYLKHIVAISAGWDHSMALEKYAEYDSYLDWSDPCYIWPDPNHRGRVYTWGNNARRSDRGPGKTIT